jgi:hypothetical protein
MSSRPVLSLFVFWLGLFFLVCSPGCSSPVKEVDIGDIGALRTIASAYSKAAAKTGRPPTKPADLKPFLPEGADIEQLMSSTRDGQPYVILWGTDPRPGKAGVAPVVIGYETLGKNGTRFVFLDMGVVTMSDAQFAKANFPPGKKPD